MLLEKLESALAEQRPRIAKSLLPGLPEVQIRQILNRAKVGENVDAVVALYSWKNGSDRTDAQQTFFPESLYQFLSLEAAVEKCLLIQKAVKALVELGSPIEMPQEDRRYIPAFWDGVTGFLAIDLKQGMRNRMMAVEFESEVPFREICDSFEAFLTSVTRAIQQNERPAFLDPDSYP